VLLRTLCGRTGLRLPFLPQLRQHVFTVTFNECALVGARRMKDQMVKAEIDILLGIPEMRRSSEQRR
jgi:hypothetical protein